MKNILGYFAFVYSAVCLIQAIFLPPNFLASLDNLLFPMALLSLLPFFKKAYLRSWELYAFILFFVFVLFSEILHNGGRLPTEIATFVNFTKGPLIFLFLNLHHEFIFKLKLQKVLYVAFGVLIALNLFMILNMYGSGQWLQNVFSPKPEMNNLFFNVTGTFRLSGTQMNPNDNGIIWGVLCLFFFFSRFKSFHLGIICLVFLFTTQSRTVFIGFGLTSLCFLFARYLNRENLKRIALIFTGIVAILIPAMLYGPKNLSQLLNGSAFKSHSFQQRFQNFTGIFDQPASQQWFGNGWMRTLPTDSEVYIDSEWLTFFYSYGFIGFALLLLTFALFVLKIYRMHEKFKAAHGVLILVAIAGLSNFVLLNDKISIFVFVILFILCSFYTKFQEVADNQAEEQPSK